MRRVSTLPDILLTDEESLGTSVRQTRANYSSLREALLRSTPAVYHCNLFCGGKRCKYCRPDSWRTHDQAIAGLYSHWVTADILAMSRPTEKLMVEHKIIEQFKKSNIRSVINLQRAGEHGRCGQGVLPCGFSYDPEHFMKSGIYHYNFGWPDFGTTSISTLLDMVKVFSFAVNQGKVAVHCHAGLGRTGVLICCFLIWNNRLSANSAITMVRQKRTKAVQTTEQLNRVYDFAEFVKPLRTVFQNGTSLEEYCQRQRLTLHGYEYRVLKNIPKDSYLIETTDGRYARWYKCTSRLERILYVAGERLLELVNARVDGSILQELERFPCNDDYFYEKILEANKACSSESAALDADVDTESMQSLENPSVTHLQMVDQLTTRSIPEPKINPITIKISRSLSNHAVQLLRKTTPPTLVSLTTVPSNNISSSLIDLEKSPKINRLPPLQQPLIPSYAAAEQTNGHKPKPPPPPYRTTEEYFSLADFLANTAQYHEFYSEKVSAYKKSLSCKDDAWKALASEKDPQLLLMLLDAWFDTCLKPAVSVHLIQSTGHRNHSAKSQTSTIQKDSYAYLCNMFYHLSKSNHLTSAGTSIVASTDDGARLLAHWVIGDGFADEDFIQQYVVAGIAANSS